MEYSGERSKADLGGGGGKKSRALKGGGGGKTSRPNGGGGGGYLLSSSKEPLTGGRS